MEWRHLWKWVGIVCLFSAGAAYAQQDQSAVSGSSSGASAAVAAVPRLIKYSGEVRDARGEPLGSVSLRLTFAVYEAQLGGAALWAEAQVAQLDEQGQYSVLLGATRADGLPVELFPAGKARWLGVQVEGRDEDPRVLLVSVPYALKAEDAAMLGGRRASDFVLAEQLKEEVRTQVEAQKPVATSSVETLVSNPANLPAISEGPSTFTCATTGDCVAVTQSGTGRALRATATSASEAALLQQNGTGYGLRVLSQSNYAIYGVVQGAVVGTTYGVRGLVNSTTGAGILGSNTATTGIAYGLMGLTSSVSGMGLYGRALSTTGATFGLTGDADSTSGKGIMGRATAGSGTTMGIYAEARSAGGTALVVNNTASGKLVSGQANGVEKFSVSGSGNLVSAGTLSGTQLISTVASGTAPLSVTSNTLVPNLNADLLDGLHAANFAALGANSFSGNQNVTGNVSATGSVSGGSGSFTGSTSTVGSSIVTVTQQGSTTTDPGFSTLPPTALLGEASTTTNFATGVTGMAHSPDGNGVVGVNDATTGYASGLVGLVLSTSGTGVSGVAAADSGNTTGVYGQVESPSGTAGDFNNNAGGNILLGESYQVNRFRVDGTGKGFFNGGTQTGGADFAESFAVAGERARYGPGDVLVIDPLANRRVALSSRPYSTAVAGIYSTKPGVLATPYEMDDGRLTKEIPLAIVGIVPCKVTAENGAIEPGDLLVSASTPGHAMKGTDRARMLGAVVGKALEALPGGTGVIQVLVTLQ
jgi:hypothetical protein